MLAVGPSFGSDLAAELKRRTEAGLLRRLRPVRRTGAYVVSDTGARLVNLSSNDYLGLSTHPAVIEAAVRGAHDGAGATASRLIVGDDRSYEALEARLAAFQHAEAALVFGSGYLANVGVISALVGHNDAVFSDKLNHASIVDGCRLSRATVHRYRHGDLGELEAALARASNAGVRRKLIVTESVFSMDGDVAPLAGIVELKERYGAALLVDEAHAEGVFGPRGEGYVHELGLAGRVELHLGTFSKAFGCYGAYVAGDSSWIDYLVSMSRTFIFTTALPPSVIGAVDAALGLVESAGVARATLRASSARFREALGALGLSTGTSSTQIVPLHVGASEEALELSSRLEQLGVLSVAIRPPTVARGSARLRFSLTAAHTRSDLERSLGAIGEAVAPPGSPSPPGGVRGSELGGSDER